MDWGFVLIMVLLAGIAAATAFKPEDR